MIKRPSNSGLKVVYLFYFYRCLFCVLIVQIISVFIAKHSIFIENILKLRIYAI